MKASNARWALSAVLIAALIAAVSGYPGREGPAQSTVGDTVARGYEQVRDEGADEAPSVFEPTGNADTAQSRVEVPDTSGVKILYSSPDYGSDAYREAYAEAGTFLAALGSGFSRNVVVKADTDAIAELIQQLESNPGALDQSFSVSAFSDVPCIITSVRSRTPRFTPGSDDIPQQGYWVEAACEQSRTTLARISVDRDEGTFRVDVVSQNAGVFAVLSLGDWTYSLAYRDDESSDAFPLSGE